MANFLLFLLSGLFALGATHTPIPDPNSLDFPKADVCLTAEAAQNGISPGLVNVPKKLFSITKATVANTTQGYEIPRCQNRGGCDGPSVANYKLVSTGVKVDHVIFPNSFSTDITASDRQLVKQLDFTTDPILADRYKNRIYRTFCGDWCRTCNTQDIQCDAEGLNCTCSTQHPPVSLPFRGSFHCDFIFYLEDTDSDGKLQIDEDGNLSQDHQNLVDPRLPSDGSLFSVYFRDGASLPPSLRCAPTPTGESKLPVLPMIGKLFRPQKVMAYDDINKPAASSNILEYPDKSGIYWLLDGNSNNIDGSYKARNTQINLDLYKKYPLNGNSLLNPIGITGNFEVYKNLLDPEGDFYIYLVPKGILSQTISLLGNRTSISVGKFSYFRFVALDISKPGQRTLKLGNFIPPARSWVRGWIEESKPAIYLYPAYPLDLNIILKTQGKLTVSIPFYEPHVGWNVRAFPDGSIIYGKNKYPYLYYEAILKKVKVDSSGFIVSKNKLHDFFREKLAYLGLTAKETDDFLSYWIPRLLETEKEYYFIHFLPPEEIEKIEPVVLSHQPDTTIRIRPYFKPVEFAVPVRQQILSPAPVRKGFTFVEWGGILDK